MDVPVKDLPEDQWIKFYMDQMKIKFDFRYENDLVKYVKIY